MLKTSLIKATTPLQLQSHSVLLRHGVSSTLVNRTSYRRTFASSTFRLQNEGKLNAVQSQNEEDMSRSSSSAISELTKPGAVSTVPRMVRGDWVLFHPVYSSDELKAVEVLHRETKTISDKIAYGLVKTSRRIFDFISGYKHVEGSPDPSMSLEQLRKAGFMLDDRQWLHRILFLESIAGVPGMVAATLRHLQSLRLMRRDSGWIHTCLEEAENERMHLMTFMTLRPTSIWFRGMILGAQGVFYNLFFLCYLFSPKACHRFVGYLEEEAVITYTRCIADLEAGLIPEWSNKPAPEIAIDYWRLKPDAKLLDVIYAVRSDETTHRFVNHSLANLEPSEDVNPFALREPDMHVKGRKIAFERPESADYVRQSHEIMQKKLTEAEKAN